MILEEREGHLHRLGLFYKPLDRQPYLVAYASTFEDESQTDFEDTWDRLKGKLCYIQYYDHLLFKNVKEDRVLAPVIRETVGWLVEDGDGYIKLLWDRSIEKLPQERSQDKISGMIILKPLILEIKEVDLE
ncbi:MAG: hypothetical protein DRN90_03650 [Thermoproteota archaeon]|nr:MAG: hypothetical protein DRN90_03650 [Candidatus Korarchaeota archaeon]RLG48836.1 MAG: hypothetical protein DRN92_00115 [Candidatus Korarchaeota archaeon]